VIFKRNSGQLSCADSEEEKKTNEVIERRMKMVEKLGMLKDN
jgi:hypothetical protein